MQCTDQSFLSCNAKERHDLEKELYVPCYFWKISKAALLKEKRTQLWNHFLLFKLFYSRKKTTRGHEKKNLFSAFDLFLGFSIPPALWDDAVCQIPTAPVSASSGHSPPHTITLLSEAAGTLPAHADSITAWRTAPLWGRSSPLGARQQGTRRAGRVRQLTNKKLLCYSLPLLPPKAQRECGRGKRCSSARSSSMALPGRTASRTTPGHPFMEV